MVLLLLLQCHWCAIPFARMPPHQRPSHVPCTGVQQAVAVAVLDADAGQKRLVGYVTPGNVAPADVLNHCRDILVPAMVPSLVVVMESFPLLPNGKVATRALPPPTFGVPSLLKYVAPTNPTEQVCVHTLRLIAQLWPSASSFGCVPLQVIQTIWMDVLGITEPISIDADYFELGGMRLAAYDGVVFACCVCLSASQLTSCYHSTMQAPPSRPASSMPAFVST